MPYLKISNLGSIANKELGTNITGSATLITASKDILGGLKVIIDFGMYQGNKKSDELNKLLDDNILNIVEFKILLDIESNIIIQIRKLINTNKKLISKNKANYKKSIEINEKKIIKLINKNIDLFFNINKKFDLLNEEELIKLFKNKDLLEEFRKLLNEKKILFFNRKKYLSFIKNKQYNQDYIYNEKLLKKNFNNNVNEEILKQYILKVNEEKELINADVLIVTHAHMDHIGRIPLLVKKGFKGRIIMDPFTKVMASHQWTDYIALTNRDIEKKEFGNKRKTESLKKYITILDIEKKLSIKGISTDEKNTLNKRKNKILEGKSLDLFKNEIVDFLGRLNSDIDIVRLFSKKEAENLIDLNEKVEKITINRLKRVEKDLNDFNLHLKEAVKYLENEDNDLLEKEKFILSFYPNEAKIKKDSLSNVNSVEFIILNDIEYEKNYKSDLYKKESIEIRELSKKIKKIIKDKDLSICLAYANKTLGKNNFKEIKSNVPELLYNINDVYDALKMIETLEVGEEINLDSRIVVTKRDSDVINKIPQLIEDGYDKVIYVLPQIKQAVINKWKTEYKQTVEYNNEIREIKLEFFQLKKELENYNRIKNKNKIIIQNYSENSELTREEQIELYFQKIFKKLENNPIFKLRKELNYILKIKNKLKNSEDKFRSVQDRDLDLNGSDTIEVEKEIIEFKNIKIEGFGLKELLDFYNKIGNFIKNKNGKHRYNIDLFLNDLNFFENNSKIIKILFDNDKRNLNFILDLENEINNLEKNKNQLLREKELIIEKNKFLLEKDNFIFELEDLDVYGIESQEDIERIIKDSFSNKKLKYTKKQIEKAKSKLKIISEKENEKVVESLKLTFLKAGHVEGSIMASLSYVTKEIKSSISGILNYGIKKFNGHKEIKKSFKNLLFSGDIGKFTQPNLSGKPDIPKFKYDYVQLESTYANREHPDKYKEMERLIEILNRPGRKLGATFSFQRAQEVPTELQMLSELNLSNTKQLKKLYGKRNKLNAEYKKIQNGEDNIKIQNKFVELSSINQKIYEIQKKSYDGIIMLDSPGAAKITNEFIKYFSEKYKILDPLVQKDIFGKEKFIILGPGEHKKLYNSKNKYKDFFLLSSSGMGHAGKILEHIKELVGDKNATIILFGFVAEGTIGRQLLNGAKSIKIDGKSYDVKCNVEFIGGFSSHMGQSDLVNFGGNLINYSKDAILSLTHGDESRNVLKGLIKKVNSKVNIIIPELNNKLKINL